MTNNTTATTSQLMAETLEYAQGLAALAASLEPDDPDYAHATGAAKRMIRTLYRMGTAVTPDPTVTFDIETACERAYDLYPRLIERHMIQLAQGVNLSLSELTLVDTGAVGLPKQARRQLVFPHPAHDGETI